ncbi:MAG: cyclopropane-fatty-acyl-phospholipid synthase family protein [Candidatus Krumholzibacteriia bacterium]
MTRWDERYDHERYFYGRTPNYFIAEQLPLLPKGRGLYLAEGEGRNAVFAAGLGHHVVAVDASAVGRRKALALAEDRGVAIHYHVRDVMDEPWRDQAWDHAVLCFVHMDPAHRAELHRRVAGCLKPGGTLVYIGFAKAQFGRSSGGPPREDWLHELDVVREEFPAIELEHAVEREVDLQEGVGHVGQAMVIEMLGAKV